MQNKIMAVGGDAMAQKQAVHINLGEAHARAPAAGALLDRLVAATEDLMTRRAFDLNTRLQIKMRAGHLSDLCREGVNAMMARGLAKFPRQRADLQNSLSYSQTALVSDRVRGCGRKNSPALV